MRLHNDQLLRGFTPWLTALGPADPVAGSRVAGDRSAAKAMMKDAHAATRYHVIAADGSCAPSHIRFRCAESTSINRSQSTGLLMWSSQPKWRHSSRFSSVAYAVRAMIGPR